MHRLAHSRASALPLPFDAPQEASLIQPTSDPAETIDAAKIVAQNILAITRISLFYASLLVTARPGRRPTCEGDYEMPETKDKDQAAETRPVPSQAEGDEETVDEALRQKEQQKDKK
jgi:hypothetical protein